MVSILVPIKHRYLFFAIIFLSGILIISCDGVIPASQFESTVTPAQEQETNRLFFILTSTNQALDKQSLWWFTEIIFLSTPDGTNVKVVGTYEDRGIVWLFDSFNQGQTMLAGILPEPEDYSSGFVEDRFGTLYLHETYYGSSNIISSKFDLNAYFSPNHDGIVFTELDEQGNRHIIYRSDMNGTNRITLSDPNEDSYGLVTTNDPDHVYFLVRIESPPGNVKFPYKKIDIKTGETLSLCGNLNGDYRVTPNAKYIACEQNNQIIITDQENNLILRRNWDGKFINMKWASNNIDLLVIVEEHKDTRFYIWNVSTDRVRGIYFGEIQGSKWSTDPEWSPDGKELLISSQNQENHISTYYTFDVATSKIMPVLDKFDYDKQGQFLRIIGWAK